MNILYYLQQFPAIGGIETVTATVANYLALRGHVITILSHKSKDNAKELLELDPRISLLHMPEVENITLRNTAYLQQVIRERKIDITIFQDSYAEIERNLFTDKTRVVSVEHNSPFYKGLNTLLKFPLIVRILWHLKHPFWRYRREAFEGRRRRFLYDHSAAYVLLSNRFFGEFRAVTKLFDTRRLRAIPNPISDKICTRPREKENIVLFCGSLNSLKGCDYLISAWKLFCNSCNDWRLVIVGDGPERVKLEAQAAELKNVFFEGYKSDPSDYFARAKIFAFPSRREGWGLVLVEAMANGCVPIAFDSYSAVHDIIANEENGYVVPAFDIEAYAKRLVELANDDTKRESISAQARKSAERFSIAKIGPMWEFLLSEVSRNGGGAIICEHSAPYAYIKR